MKMKYKCKSVFIFIYSTYVVAAAQEVNEPCTIQHNAKNGICKYQKDCPSAVALIKKGIRPTLCGFDGSVSIICCDADVNTQFQETTTTRTSTRPVGQASKKYCADHSKTVMKVVATIALIGAPELHLIKSTSCDYNSVPLISGGEPAKAGEFPHMVALGHQEVGKISWHCGGTLISENYVLTAAHCRNRAVTVDFARIGDLNLEENEEITDPEFNPLTVRVEKFIPHPEYKPPPKYNDIAIVKLERSVNFTKFIRPACLWQTSQFNRSKTIATGWGQTKNATISKDHLRKVVLDIIPSNICKTYPWLGQAKKQLPQGIRNTILCAGDITGKMKDTCKGDSGGPLVVNDIVNSCIFHAIGITSFGSECAEGIPAIYTRVSEYIQWIESIVWPA